MAKNQDLSKKELSAGSTMQEQFERIANSREASTAEVENMPATAETVEAANTGVENHANEVEAEMHSNWESYLGELTHPTDEEITPAVEAQLDENKNAAAGALETVTEGIKNIAAEPITADAGKIEDAQDRFIKGIKAAQAKKVNGEDAQDRFIKAINAAQEEKVARIKAGEAPENLPVPSDAEPLLEPEPLPPLLAESEPLPLMPEDINLPSAEEAGFTAPETPVENPDIAFFAEELRRPPEINAAAVESITLTRERADNDYNRYTRRQNVFSRYISQKREKISNWSDRITGLSGENKKDWSDTRYDLLGRASVRIKNFFAGTLLNHRNNRVMKAEGKLGDLRAKITEQEAENEVNRQIRDNPDIPYKERKRAAKDFNAGFSRINKWRSQEASNVTRLQNLENMKEQCWNGIQERSLAVSRDIEERIRPMQEKLADAKSILVQAEQARNEALFDRNRYQQSLDDLRIRLLSVPKADRAKVKAAIATCNKALKEYDKKFNKAELGLNACHENIGHLESLLNPWQDLSNTYQMMAEKPQYVTEEKKPEYRSTAERVVDFRNEAGSMAFGSRETVIGDNESVNIRNYLTEVSDNLGSGVEKFRSDEIAYISGANRLQDEIKVSELEKKISEVLDLRGLSKSRIDGILNMTRVKHKKIE